MQFVRIADLLVNLDNVVAFDIDKGNVKRVWYRGSDAPIPLEQDVSASRLEQFLRDRGWLVD